MLYNVAVLGATGAVGQEILSLLEDRSFPVKRLYPLASSRSAGKKVIFKGEEIKILEAGTFSFEGVDFVFSSAGGNLSRELLPRAVEAGAVAVDNTSFFRMEPRVPLVVPEVNGHRVREHRGIIANPNCNVIILSLLLGPLHKAYGIKRLFISTYQAASGAGRKAMEELEEESAAFLEGRAFSPSVIPYPYAFNCFVHNTKLMENGYVEEEWKVINEIRKILEAPDLPVNVNCIRVPVLRAHGEVVNLELETTPGVEELYHLLNRAPGLEVFGARGWNARGLGPTPRDATGKDEVLVGRIREDLSRPGAYDIWLVGDQIRKGAALNAVQIGESLISS